MAKFAALPGNRDARPRPEMRVEINGSTGSDTMAPVKVGGQMRTARLGRKARLKPGASVTPAVGSVAINPFDPAIGDRMQKSVPATNPCRLSPRSAASAGSGGRGQWCLPPQ